MGKSYGYARVSSRDQNPARQLEAFQAVNLKNEVVFVDKISGKNFEREQYQKLLKKMRKGDLLYIKSIDRLGRNYQEIKNQWQYLTQKKQIDIVVLDMPLLDTREGKDLMGTFISDLILQLLSYVAENERNMIRQRQSEGIAAAKSRGVKFGKPPMKLPDNFEQEYQNWKRGEITGIQAAERCHMPKSTFYYKAKYYAGSDGKLKKRFQ